MSSTDMTHEVLPCGDRDNYSSTCHPVTCDIVPLCPQFLVFLGDRACSFFLQRDKWQDLSQTSNGVFLSSHSQLSQMCFWHPILRCQDLSDDIMIFFASILCGILMCQGMRALHCSSQKCAICLRLMFRVIWWEICCLFIPDV